MARSPVQELESLRVLYSASLGGHMPWGSLGWAATARGRSCYPGEGEGPVTSKSFWNSSSLLELGSCLFM